MNDFMQEMKHIRQLLEETNKTNFQVQVKIGPTNYFGINVPEMIQEQGFYVRIKGNEHNSFLKIFVDNNGLVSLRVGDGEELGKRIFDFSLNDTNLLSNVLTNSVD